MPIVVQKYGGTSVADPERIEAIAERVVATRRAGNDVVVVVSAMGDTTDQLVELAHAISPNPPAREMDMLLTAGERITMALTAMAIQKRGFAAVSFTGSQAGILTDSSHGEARIKEITGQRVSEALTAGKVAIVAGFQGVDPDSRDVTTLGRGGSDTTAVALAASLGAERCDICTDVPGVFTADPRIVSDAVRLDRITYEEMIALAVNGAGVLTEGAVDFGRRFSVPIQVRSSFTDDVGTWVVSDAEPVLVRGIAHRAGAVTLVGSGIAGSGDLAARGAAALESGGIRSTMTVGDGVITYLVAGEQTELAVRLLHSELRPPVILEEVSKK